MKMRLFEKTMVLLLAAGLGLCASPAMAEEAVTETESEAFETVETIEEAESEAESANALSAPAALTYDYDEITVGTTTAFDGNFFTEMWGTVVSDLDVRTLIHGYNLVEWRSEEGAFGIDPSVVSGTVVTENADGDRTYTLTIYDDLAYNDGTPITASDYAFSMLLQMAPQMEELGATTRRADYILGYEEYISGRSDVLTGLRILGDHTFSVTIDHDYLPFFYELALLDCTPYPISVIAPGCRVEDNGNGVHIVNEDATVTEPIFTAQLLEDTVLNETDGYRSHPSLTSGPYTLTSFDGSEADFERNTYYKGNSDGVTPTIERIRFLTADNASMIDELGQGEFGLLNKCTNQDALVAGTSLVANDKQFAMSNYARSGMSFISFCCEQKTVASAAVRQAIAMCLDKDRLVNDYVGMYGLRTDGYFGIGQWMYQLVNHTLAYPLDPPEDENDEEAQKEYEEKLEAWESLSLDDVKVYELDENAAVSLLEGDGWTLDENGDPFDPAEDAVRCKEIDGELVALDLTLFVPEGNRIADSMQEAFIDNLAKAGIALTIEQLPMSDLLRQYYRQDGERTCDMIYLATNFDVVFDPSQTFRPEEAGTQEANAKNVTGINDPQLYELAVDMRRTEPGDTLSYCQKWLEFQKRFADVLPVIPVYSNVYFDFYPRVLHNYNVSANITWGQAIVEAYLSDAADLEEETETTSEQLSEGEVIIG